MYFILCQLDDKNIKEKFDIDKSPATSEDSEDTCPVTKVHYENLPIQYTQFFLVVKMKIFTGKISIFFLIFAPKHRLWVHVRTALARRLLRVPTIYVLEQK